MVKHIPSYRVSAALWERHLQNLCKGQHPLLDPCLWSRRDASKTAENTDMSQKHCYVAQATALQTCRHRRTASTLSRTRTSHSASKIIRRVGGDLTGAADSSDAICGHPRHQCLPTMLPGHCRRQPIWAHLKIHGIHSERADNRAVIVNRASQKPRDCSCSIIFTKKVQRHLRNIRHRRRKP